MNDIQFEEFKKIVAHINKNRDVKARKLMRIEKLVLDCIAGGYTDEFLQEILNICWEMENE